MDYENNFNFLTPYIGNDEQILWKGKPGKGNIFSGRDIVMLPFSIMWLSFCLVWEYTAIKSGSSIFFMLWGLPFIGVGIYMLFGGFIRKARLKNKTYYVITNKKIIIKSGNNIELYNGKDLPPMRIKLHKNGSGTITFNEDIYITRGRVRSTYCMLENLADVVQAQRAVSRMLEEGAGTVDDIF